MPLITGITVRRRVRSEFARTRLTEAAYDAAMDALHPALHEVTRFDERVWLRTALAKPLHLAVEAALDVLAIELDVALEEAPPSLRRKIEETPRWRVSGWE
jgi:hypothetical protein